MYIFQYNVVHRLENSKPEPKPKPKPKPKPGSKTLSLSLGYPKSSRA